MNGMKHKRLTGEEADKLHGSIEEMYSGVGSYSLMAALAAVVASLGLLVDSTAVIIGAMLISPIMGPILGISFSISTGISKMMSKAFAMLLLGVAVALAVSIVMTQISPQPNLTSEILARTKPTITDLLIAIASGAAGAYTLCISSSMTTFAGVAIATALMPPLCVVGIGISIMDISVAVGGALLFTANLVGINLAASIVFWTMGISVSQSIGGNADKDVLITAKTRKKRLLLSLIATFVIAIPLAAIMAYSVHKEQTDTLIRESLERALASYRYIELVDYEYTSNQEGYQIQTVVRTELQFDGEDIKQIQEYLSNRIGKSTSLTMELVIVKTVNETTVHQT